MIELKTLLLEDSPTDAEIIQRVLRKEYVLHARVVSTKEAFLKALDEFQPDIILADNSLPQFNAVEALKLIRSRSLYTPFILVTGTVSEEYAAGIIKQGADDFILKDRLGRLPAAVDAAMKQRQHEKEKLAAQQELAKSAESLRTLLERISDGFVALDNNWRYTYANQKVGEMTRRDPQTLIGKYIWNEFPDAIGSPTYTAFMTAMREQRYITNDDYYPELDLWYENHIYPSSNGISVFIRDISERKRAEKELSALKDRLFFHIESSPLGFIEWDDQLLVRSWSRRAEEIFGWSEQEMIELQRNAMSIVYEEDLPKLSTIGERMLAGDMPRSSVQHRNWRKDGRVIWCEWFNSVSKDKKGNTTILSLVQDVTERKVAEQSLRESERRLKEAQSIAHIASWEVDLATRKQTWSDELYRIFGIERSEGEASRQLFLSFVHPEDRERINAEANAIYESTQNAAMHFRIIRKDGQLRYGYSEWKWDLDNSGRPFRLYGIMQDITERKEAELALQRTNEELHKLSAHLQDVREEERIHIAREIHDELGQQLTGLKMDMYWLRKKLRPEDQDLIAKADEIISLIDETVKSVRRISSSLRPSILDDLGLIAALEWHSEEVQKRSEIEVNFHTDMEEPELPLSVSTGIFRIYQEVLTNAVRHSNAHFITSSLAVHEDQLVLHIKDDGKGMDQAMVAAKKTLGLVGIRERTYLLGGRFEMDSAPGKGTAITITIPLNANTKP